jgi:hypothetical protein
LTPTLYFTLAWLPPPGTRAALLDCDFETPQDARRDWLAGQIFADPPTATIRLRAKLHADAVLPALCQVPIPLMSAELVAALASAAVSNLVTYPAHLLDADGAALPGAFRAFNLIGLVHSGPPAPGPRLSKSRLDAASASGLLLFRVADAPYALLASDTLRRRLEPAGIAGLRFTPSEAWSA